MAGSAFNTFTWIGLRPDLRVRGHAPEAQDPAQARLKHGVHKCIAEYFKRLRQFKVLRSTSKRLRQLRWYAGASCRGLLPCVRGSAPRAPGLDGRSGRAAAVEDVGVRKVDPLRHERIHRRRLHLGGRGPPMVASACPTLNKNKTKTFFSASRWAGAR